MSIPETIVSSPIYAHEAGKPNVVRWEEEGNAALALLDDPQEWVSFGRVAAPDESTPYGAVHAQDGEVWESQVVLEGMHCAACALTIEDALCAVEGVLRADVSSTVQRARVFWMPGKVLPSRWMDAVRSAGYKALPANDIFVREQRLQETRRMMWRCAVAGFCMMQVMMYAVPTYGVFAKDLTPEMERLLRWASWVLTLPVMAFSCGPFFRNAWRDVRACSISMDMPVALGMAIAFVVSTAGTFDPAGPLGREVYFDSLTMFVFFLLMGRWMELRLRDKTAGSLEALMNRLPQSVERREPDGSFRRIVARRIALGDVIRVLPGEAFPADGVILEGQTMADESLLTGESQAVGRQRDSEVIAGSYNLHAPVLVRVDRLGADTRYAQIVALMENASLDKPRLVRLADRVAKPFLIAVIMMGIGAGIWWWPQDHSKALMVCVSVFIVTCPCALSLATPTAMLSAAGALARRGVLVRSLQAFETLTKVNVAVFDKTGTLTRDNLVLRNVRVFASQFSQAETVHLAAVLGAQSLHPVSRALAGAAQAEGAPLAPCLSEWELVGVEEQLGLGLRAQVRNMAQGGALRTLRLGSRKFCRHLSTDHARGAANQHAAEGTLQTAYLAEEDAQGGVRVLAQFDLAENVREDAAQTVQALQVQGMDVLLLSGDRERSARRIADLVGIQRVRGECTPSDKLRTMRGEQQSGHRVLMVGDGMNDGPIIAGADVSFAFGRSVPLAQAQADYVVLADQLGLIPKTVALSRRTMQIVRQNLLWAAMYNAACVPLAVMGLMPAWLAGLGMALSSLLVVGNAARLSRSL